MNELFTQTFDDFSAGLSTSDLFLYAGAGLLLYFLFQDKLGGLKKLVTDLVSKSKQTLSKPSSDVANPQTVLSSVVSEKKPVSDSFVELIVSWKHTRDLAENCKNKQAVELMDKLFPSLNASLSESKTNELK